MYVLNLADDGHVLSAGIYEIIPPDAVVVDTLPEGDISEYLYVDGQYVHDPLPVPEVTDSGLSDTERIAALEEALELLLSGATE